MSLRTGLLAVVEAARALTGPAGVDIRINQLTIRTRVWSGGRLRLGTSTDTDLVLPAHYPVRYIMAHEVSNSGGQYEAGDILVNHITPSPYLSPKDTKATIWLAPGGYTANNSDLTDKAHSKWTASIGTDIVPNNFTPTVPMMEPNGTPFFDAAGQSVLTGVSYLTNALPFASFFSYTDHHVFASFLPRNVGPFQGDTNDPVALTGPVFSQSVFTDQSQTLGIYVHQLDGVYYATYFETTLNSTELRPAFARVALGSELRRFNVQAKKTGGFLWIRLDDQPWVQGEAAGDLDPQYVLFDGLQVGQGAYDGQIFSVATWPFALSDQQSNRLLYEGPGYTYLQLNPLVTTDDTEIIYVINGEHQGEYSLVDIRTYRPFSYQLVLRRSSVTP